MFKEKISEHAEWVAKIFQTYPDIAKSEAKTKITLIEPLLRCLGYDPSNPAQVKPEDPTDIGGKVDYVLTGTGHTKIAVESKRAEINLSGKEINQLRSYFTFSEAVAGILTNGVDYWLFTDLDKTNVMDSEPYHKINIRQPTDNDIQHLDTLTRTRVQPDAIRERALQERYRRLVRGIVHQELAAPSQEFLKLIGDKVGNRLSQPDLKVLAPLVGEAICSYQGNPPPPPPPPPGIPLQIEVENRTYQNGQPYRKFKRATLFGQELPVGAFAAMLEAVVAELIDRHPDKVPEVFSRPVFKGTKWWQISTDRTKVSPHSGVQVGSYWVDIHHSAEDAVKNARRYLEEFGYNPAVREIEG